MNYIPKEILLELRQISYKHWLLAQLLISCITFHREIYLIRWRPFDPLTYWCHTSFRILIEMIRKCSYNIWVYSSTVMIVYSNSECISWKIALKPSIRIFMKRKWIIKQSSWVKLKPEGHISKSNITILSIHNCDLCR